MAISTVKADLDSIANGIRNNEVMIQQALAKLQAVADDFAEYPTRYGDTIAEINAFAPTGAFETLSKDELAQFVVQFSALVGNVTTAIGALS